MLLHIEEYVCRMRFSLKYHSCYKLFMVLLLVVRVVFVGLWPGHGNSCFLVTPQSAWAVIGSKRWHVWRQFYFLGPLGTPFWGRKPEPFPEFVFFFEKSLDFLN